MRSCRVALLLVPSFALAEGPGIGILDAVRSTLELHPILQSQRKQVDIGRAIRQQRSAAFDTLVEWSGEHNRTNTPLTHWDRELLALQSGFHADNQAANLTTLNGSAQRLLRSGVVIGPRIEMNRLTDNLQAGEGASRARLSFEIVMPLRRGRGRDVVTAPERSAGIDIEASLHDVDQTVAELVLTTAVSYWRYLGSHEQLEIASGSEERGRQFVESVRTLIDAGKIPRNEINQVNANLASRSAVRASLEQQVAEARSNLALAIGLAAPDFADVPRPSDPLPEAESIDTGPVSPDAMRLQIAGALKRRADLLAAESRVRSADVQRKAAANGVLPRMDLTFSAGYSGLREGRRPDEFLVPPFTNTRGPDLILGLRYSIPRGNNLARGRVAETEAAYAQAVLAGSERARAIAGEVTSSTMAVHNSIERLRNAREAVKGYQAALEGEKDKLRLGIGSLIDMLTIESRLTEALLDKVGAQMAYAIAIAQFRFASGTLVSAQSLERDTFYAPPRMSR